nr:MAG TPA: Protein of unknown function (DUF551) [Caudoviricetes sp.]
MSQWIKCSDRIPEMNKYCMSEYVVVMCADGYPRIDFVLNGKWFTTKKPFYWMPLPNNPENCKKC